MTILCDKGKCIERNVHGPAQKRRRTGCVGKVSCSFRSFLSNCFEVQS